MEHIKRMILIKKLKRPNRLSGKPLKPGEVSEWRKLGIKVVNTGKDVLHVDSYTPKRKKNAAR